MSKDPSFLFYPADYLVGTMFLTYEQKGKYMDLLCLQHQKGNIQPSHMFKVISEADTEILDKFVFDDDGNYYNIRLKTEMEKRAAYSQSRRNNRSGKDIKEQVDAFIADYIKYKNPNYQESPQDRELIEKVLKAIGSYDAAYWQKVFRKSSVGWEIKGEIVPIPLEKVLEKHSAIASGETTLKPPKKSTAPITAPTLSPEEEKAADEGFQRFKQSNPKNQGNGLDAFVGNFLNEEKS